MLRRTPDHPSAGADDRNDADGRLSDEVQFHIEQQTEKLIRQGMSPGRARREALLRFGGVEAMKDSARDQMRLAWFRDFGRDVRLGLRGMRRTPGFAAVAALTLGLGIGASTALFSVVDGVLLRDLPYPDAHRIVRLYQMNTDGTPGSAVRRSGNVSEPNAIDWRERTRSFQAIGLMSQSSRIPVVAGTEPIMARRTVVSTGFFTVMGVAPATGRGFSPAELTEGGVPAAIVSRAFSLRAFGGAVPPDATVRIGQTTFAVVGEMPAGFDYPAGTDLWTPQELLPTQTARTAHNFQAVARLADGVALEAANADLSAVSRALKNEYGDETWMADAVAVPLLEQTTAAVRPAIQLLFWAAALLFVIACTNVSNLLLARETARQQEVALQLAIGAGRWRIVRQRLAETLVLCGLGAGAGVVVAALAIRGLLALDPGSVPRLQEVGVNWPVITFAFVAALAATLAIGVVTAIRRSDRDIRAVLGDSQRGAIGGRGRERTREVLVVTQVALTLMLLAGTSLLGRSFVALLAVDPGYRTDGLVVLDLVVPGAGVPDAGRRQWQLQQELMTRVRALPGVERVGLTSGLPAGGGGYADGRYLEMTRLDEIQSFDDVALLGDRVMERAGQAGFRVVGGDYFETMDIPLLAGRTFQAGDTPEAPHVAVVSRSFADDRWPGRDPIGRFVQFGNMDGDLRGFRIVGVVGDVRELSPEATPGPLFYVDYRQRPGQASRVSLVVSGGGPDLPSTAQRLLREIDPAVPLQVRTIEDAFDTSLSGRRFNLVLITVFGATALILAVLGTYGLISYLVTARRREFGIRLALGADAATVVRLVAGRAARLAVVGTVVGLTGALLLTGLIEGLLFSVSSHDPATFGLAVVLTAAAVVAASLLPAYRATRISPTETLRG